MRGERRIIFPAVFQLSSDEESHYDPANRSLVFYSLKLTSSKCINYSCSVEEILPPWIIADLLRKTSRGDVKQDEELKLASHKDLRLVETRFAWNQIFMQITAERESTNSSLQRTNVMMRLGMEKNIFTMPQRAVELISSQSKQQIGRFFLRHFHLLLQFTVDTLRAASRLLPLINQTNGVLKSFLTDFLSWHFSDV